MRRYGRGGNAMNRDEFFREMTKRICSTLDIRTALMRSYEFLKTVMPVFVLDLSLYDPESNKETKVANIRNGTVTDDAKLSEPLPDGISNELRNFWASMGEITVFNHPAPDRITNAVYRLAEYRLAEYRHAKSNDVSILVLRLELEGKRIGVLIIVAEGLDRFTEKHANLVAILNEPFSMALSNALQYQEIMRLKDMLADDNRFLHRELRARSGNEIIGADMGLKQVMRSVRQVAQLNSPVLLLGETGTGKEVIANTIHDSSSRKDGPFIKVNCGAIPEGLIDSELFGHEKGAFTGAVSRKRGRFERAEGGSIFLDEIGDLPLLAQTRLLRVLQNKEIERVGGTESICSRRANHLRHPSRFGENGGLRGFQGGSVVPPERVSDRHSPAASETAGYSRPGAPFPATQKCGDEYSSGAGAGPRCDAAPGRPPVEGECPGAGKRRGASSDPA